jgi:hypothetical protein
MRWSNSPVWAFTANAVSTTVASAALAVTGAATARMEITANSGATRRSIGDRSEGRIDQATVAGWLTQRARTGSSAIAEMPTRT